MSSRSSDHVLAAPAPKEEPKIAHIDVLDDFGETGALLVRQANYLFLALLRRDVQRRVHVLRRRIYGRAMLEQQHHDVDVAQPRGYVQRCLLLLLVPKSLVNF